MPLTIIAFEGIDGSGKTTQAIFLKKALERDGYKVSIIGRRFIFQTIISFLYIFSKNRVIIADRYTYTLSIFFKHFGISSKIVRFLPKPHLIFYFKIDPEIAYLRLKKERNKIDKFESLYWLKIFKKEFEKDIESFICVDATKGKAEVRKTIYGLYNSRLGREKC